MCEKGEKWVEKKKRREKENSMGKIDKAETCFIVQIALYLISFVWSKKTYNDYHISHHEHIIEPFVVMLKLEKG